MKFVFIVEEAMFDDSPFKIFQSFNDAKKYAIDLIKDIYKKFEMTIDELDIENCAKDDIINTWNDFWEEYNELEMQVNIWEVPMYEEGEEFDIAKINYQLN